MVYKQDNRPKKHHVRFMILGIILGIILTIGGFYVYDNYRQPIMNHINDIQSTTEKELQKTEPIMKTISIPSTPQQTEIQSSNDQQNTQVEKNNPLGTGQNQQIITGIDPLTLEHQIHDQVNNVREQSGLKPLIYNEKLATIARNHSQDMVQNNYFDHTSPNGKTLLNRIYDAKIPCGFPGENIEQASTSDTADTIIQAWMNSSGHRNNILSEYYNSEGIGIFTSGDIIMITEDFC